MSSIAQVSDALRRVLTTRAKEVERETGFVQRSTAQGDGPTCVQTTVFGWLDTPEASYAQLRHVAASLGVSVSRQAVEQRLGAASASLLREVRLDPGAGRNARAMEASGTSSPAQWASTRGAIPPPGLSVQ